MVRQLGGLPVRQNHKTKMFNANDLIDAHNAKKPRNKKHIFNFMRSKPTIEYIEHLENRAIESQESKYAKTEDLEFPLVQGKEKSSVVITSRGRVNGGTWMHPKLFYDLAMWLSVEFKDWAMECIGDRLVELRDVAGDSFKEINIALSAGSDVRQMTYVEEARMINRLVFGSSGGGQRNEATEDQLGLLEKLQRADVKLIKQGLTFEQRKKNLTVFKSLLNA